ncbi:MAG: dienelactone hydrolase family protein [Rhodobacteraceae bacterium]|nr:MAG: dienelactone hydrolase family protein [Paracoccaceae bacterium]
MAFEGYFVPAEGEAQGLVVIVHDWDGLDAYEATRARMIAEMGYDAFALDLFGAGVRPDTLDGRRAATGALYADRAEMRARLTAGLEEAQALSGAGAATVVMGYCFGGAATLELARSGLGEGIVGFVSFHGGVDTPEGQSWPADAAPVLILHGGADQNPSMADVAQLSVELEAAGVDYEIAVYAGAPHAFTVFGSDRYRERADRLSWAAFSRFLEEATAD